MACMDIGCVSTTNNKWHQQEEKHWPDYGNHYAELQVVSSITINFWGKRQVLDATCLTWLMGTYSQNSNDTK